MTMLSACGGDSHINSSAGSPAGETFTGRFMDGPVAGLRYKTPSLEGETNADGEFQYRSGETVSFLVGDVLIGQAAGAATITPFDLAGVTPPQSDADVQREVKLIKNLPQATPLEVAANIAAFLQTLDEDGDPGNGITIPPDMHGIATGASLDFNKKMVVFRDDLSFHKLIAASRAAGLWGGSRAIRDNFYALDALYAGQGITPSFEVQAARESDLNADGTVDSRESLSYDDIGDITTRDYDFDANGTVDSHELRGFDGGGRQTLLEIDSPFDGTVDNRLVWTYDANGDMSKTEQDTNADGVVDRRHRFIFDANDKLITQELDDNADGIVDRRLTHAYDVNGNQTLVEDDTNADGTADSRETYTYNANGSQATHERDDNADGTTDYRESFTYDAIGDRTMTEVDSDGDGVVDERVTYSYDADGNQTLVEDDINADGVVDYRETHSFDVTGKRTKFEADTNGDGTVDFRTTWTYSGNQTIVEVDSNADDVVDSRYTYTATTIHTWRAAELGFSYSDEWPSQTPIGSNRF